MDATKPTPCPSCDCPQMEGWGGSFGGRINSWKLKCPECDCTLLIVPMSPKYEYTVMAQTEEEIEEREEKRKEYHQKIEEQKKLDDEINSLKHRYKF